MGLLPQIDKEPVNPFSAPAGALGNETIIEEKLQPVNLRTLFYMDMKRWLRAIGKFLLAGAIVIAIYYFFGGWGFISFALFLFISYRFLIPRIAERFMSYITFVVINLSSESPDGIMLLQVPISRFQEKAVVVSLAGEDELGLPKFEKSYLNAPFMCAMGQVYIVDGYVMDYAPDPKIPERCCDIVVSHPIHRNVDLLQKKDAFVELRKDLITLRNEVFVIKATSKIEAERLSNEKLEGLLTLIDTVLFNDDSVVNESELQAIRDEIKKMGVDWQNMKHSELTKQMFMQTKVQEIEEQGGSLDG